MNLEINNNISSVKKGMFDAIKTLKILYAKNRNIIIDKNNELYVNNIEQLLASKPENNKYYTFGHNFIYNNIENLRANLCMNPLLYLSCLEVILDRITNFSELKKYKETFNNIYKFILNYYNESAFHKTKINLDDIKSTFKSLITNEFLEDVCNKVFIKSKVVIEESKENKIILDDFYEINANYICGDKFSYNKVNILFWLSNKESLNKLKSYTYNLESIGQKLIIISSKLDQSIIPDLKNSNLTLYELTDRDFLKTRDLIAISGADNNYYDGTFSLNTYILGQVKFIFKDRKLYLKNKLFEEKDIQFLNTKNTLDRYYMLQGKTIRINCIEEDMEKVREIVSTIKSIQNEGIFYDVSTTLKLCQLFFKTDFLNKLIKRYFSLNNINILDIEKFLNQSDLDEVLDINGNFRGKTFTALAVYLTTFKLLESNIEVMSKLN